MTVLGTPYVIYDSTTFIVSRTGQCQPGTLADQPGVGESVLELFTFFPPEQIIIIPGSPDTYSIGAMFNSVGSSNAEAISAGSGTIPDAVQVANWTPTPASQSGTITTGSLLRADYFRVGALVFWNFSYSITTNGTGATGITFDLPTTPVRFFSSPGCGVFRSIGSSGSLYVFMPEGSMSVTLLKYDGTYPGADGTTLYASGCYADGGY